MVDSVRAIVDSVCPGQLLDSELVVAGPFMTSLLLAAAPVPGSPTAASAGTPKPASPRTTVATTRRGRWIRPRRVPEPFCREQPLAPNSGIFGEFGTAGGALVESRARYNGCPESLGRLRYDSRPVGEGETRGRAGYSWLG